MQTFLNGREDAPDLKSSDVKVTSVETSFVMGKLALQSSSLSSLPGYDEVNGDENFLEAIRGSD